jgi:6-phosphogluconolactonase (cycloisomerase 2 family)
VGNGFPDILNRSSLAVSPVERGTLAAASRVFTYEDTGANPRRQEASDANQPVVAPNSRWFYVCDLGSDCVWRHDVAALEYPVIPSGRPLAAHRCATSALLQCHAGPRALLV